MPRRTTTSFFSPFQLKSRPEWMSSASSLNFENYVFGEQDNDVNIYQQSVPPMPSSPSIEQTTSLSPLRDIRSMQQTKSNRPQLTKETLEKKELIDILLDPRSTRRKIRRRRSISNGNLARRLYNDDNKPMRIIHPYKRGRSDDSNASVHSHTYNTRLNNLHRNRNQNYHTHQQKHSPHSHIPAISSSQRNTTNSLKDSNHDRSYGSMANKKQSTNSRSVNTSRASASLQGSWEYPHPVTAEESNRRFSGIVRLSVAHIALQRTKKNRKRHYHSRFYSFSRKLIVMATRVMDCRAAEPKETRMTVEELMSLSKYLDKLKLGFKESDSSSSNSSESSESDTLDRSSVTREMNVPTAIEFLIDETDENTEERPTYRTFNSHDDSFTIQYNKNRHISSLGNIFPFRPINRMDSRSSSETTDPSETDRLLPLPFFQDSQRRHKRESRIPRFYARIKHYYFKIASKCIRFVRHRVRHPFRNLHRQSYEDITTWIRFEGWSLFYFSPTSTLRFQLWKIIGSR